MYIYIYCHVNGVTVDGLWIGNLIHLTLKYTTHDYALQITMTQRRSVAVFTAQLATGFRRCSDLGFAVQSFLSSLAGTYQLQLPSRNNCMPTIELTRSSVQKIAAGPSQYSLFWFRAPTGPMIVICSSSLYMF
jgi:hypothetical protein